MASITINGVWIILASSLASGQPEYIFTGSMGSMGSSAMGNGSMSATPRSDVRTTTGQVRQYANGTFRLVQTVGMLIVYTYTLRTLTWDEVETLSSWADQLILIRDRLGRCWWGSYPGLTVADYPQAQLHDVGLVFTQISYSDAV